MDRQGLRDILGSGVPDMKLEVTLQHGVTCKQLDKRFIYPPRSSQQKTRVVFNAVGQVVAKFSGSHCIPIDNLSETEKADAQKLVVAAFEHQGQIVPYDDNSPPNSTWMESPSSPNVGTPLMIAGYDCTQPSTSQVYKKRHPPSLPDEVWRLKKLCKNGVFDKCLNSENVHSVQDFRNILGAGMSAKMWEVTVDHAQTCTIDPRFYFYCPPRS